jgi:hypothetical protein
MAQQPTQYSPDGQWWWDGQQWRPLQQQGTPGSGPPPTRGRRGSGFWIIVGVAAAGAILLIVIISAALAGSPPSTKVTASARTPAAATSSSTSAAPAPPRQLFNLSGTGSGETPAFDGPSHYRVTYSFDCSNVGQSGNFALLPEDSNGNAVAGALVNRLAASGNGTADGYDLGTQKGMHLQILSECRWQVSGVSA